MKTTLRIQSIPEGEPLKDVTAVVRSIDTGQSIKPSIKSDDDGLLTLQDSGNPEPYYLYISDQPGGDKYWRSDEVRQEGPSNPADWPVAMMSLGDGVVAGYGDEFYSSVYGTRVYTLAGAAIVAGHPFVHHGSFERELSRPASGTRIDRVVIRLSMPGTTTAGRAIIDIVPGVEGAGVAAPLVQNAETWEVSLAQIPVGIAGTITSLDDRVLLEPIRKPIVSGRASLDTTWTTANTSGVTHPSLEVVLRLPDDRVYDIDATLSAVQGPVVGSTNWTPTPQWSVGTGYIGAKPALLNPGQIALNLAEDRLYIADTGNDRVVVVNPNTWTYIGSIDGLQTPTGVAVDMSGNLYVAILGAGQVKKYNGVSLALQWTSATGASPNRHVATDGTHVWATYSGNYITKFLCTTGATVSSFGSFGSGPGQFNGPFGIAYNAVAGQLAVIDAGNNRRIRYSKTFSPIDVASLWPGMRGVASLPSGIDWIARFADGMVTNYPTSDGFFQNGAMGISAVSDSNLWVSSATENTVTHWVKTSTPSGYGEIAINIDGVTGTYIPAGNRDVSVASAASTSVQGGGDALSVIRAYAKATSGTITLRSLALSANARPRG